MQKHEFEKDFYKLMNNAVFGKTMENVRNQRDIKLVTTDKRRCALTSEPNYHSTKYISKDLLVMEMRKTEVRMNKPIYLGQAILDLSKTLMYEFWYDYIKPKFGDKARLCYMDTDSFVMYIKTDDFYKDISDDVDKWFDTSNFNRNDNRPLETGKNKKVLGKFKDELGGKIIVELCALRVKAYAYKLDDDTQNKKAKGTKKCIVKREIIFQNYVDSLFKNEVLLRSQQRFRSDHHKVYIEEVNKIALSSNDVKRIQIFDKITTFPYGTSVFKICENEMLLKNKFIIKDIDKDNNQKLRDKSQVLRSEAQALRNESLLIRNELRKIRSEAQVIRDNSQKIRSEAQTLRNMSQIPKNESQEFRDKSQVLRSEAQALRNESLLIRNELRKIRSEAQVVRQNSQKIRSEAQALRGNSQ